VDLEDLVRLADAIPPARGFLWNVSEIVKGRLYLTRSEDNLPALFLEGEKDSFGPLPPFGAIRHSDDVTVLPSGEKLRALRITAANEARGGRLVAHIAYEIAWRLTQQPQPSNQDLVNEIRWLLRLLEERVDLMGAERQKGLIGECLLLRLLLRRGLERGIGAKTAINCWAGADLAKRDFYRSKIAVEVKTTGHATRLHQITSLNQLAPQEPDEEVYLFSVGIRQDPTAPRKLTHFISDVEALLIEKNGKPDIDALVAFREQLKKCGFEWGDSDLYERDAGFLAPHLMPAFFPETRLRRLSLSDFVGGKVPETVRSISYALEVTGDPLSDEEATAILDRLLGIA
jgi:putative PD-(D/E)XK family protein DUF4420